MTIQDRATRAVAAVGTLRLLLVLAGVLLLLGVSLYFNVIQWADHRAYVKGEGDRLTAAAALASTKTSAALARGAQNDNTKLLGELGAIVERGREVRVVYRKAANARPLPMQCAPGQARMDAVNAGADP